MIKKYSTYIKEQRNVIDPYGEDDWGEDDIYIIYVIGQDMNFLAKKITEKKSRRLSNGSIFEYTESYFVVAEINDDGVIHFNGVCTADSNTAYPVPEEDITKILNGEKIVGYIKWPSSILVSTIQNLCVNLECDVKDIKFFAY